MGRGPHQGLRVARLARKPPAQRLSSHGPRLQLVHLEAGPGLFQRSSEATNVSFLIHTEMTKALCWGCGTLFE